MNLPPLFIGFTLLFWGWEVGLLPMAAVAAMILELPRWVRWRWDFSDTDMNRIWDLCEILFLGAGVYGYATTDVATGPAKFIPWLPLIFFPFVAATAYSADDRVRLSTYFWLLRRKGRAVASTKPLGWFVPYWYFVVCFIATSMMNVRDLRFYIGVVALGGWLLWMFRSRSAPVWTWLGLMAIVGIVGFEGQIGLTRLQALVENRAAEMLEDLYSPDTDYTQTRTAIGSVGKLKLSARIILRVETDGRHPPPELLRRASFNVYQSAANNATWSVGGAEFSAVSPSPEFGVWTLASGRDTSSVATVSMFLQQGTGILPLPNGPAVLEGLLAVQVETNRCGSVRVHEAPPFVRYTVKYGGASTLDAPPTPADLEIPASEAPAVAKTAGDIGLGSQPPAAVLQRVQNFFQEKFTYSRYLEETDYDPTGRNTALSQFLLRDHAGHCEYFATAATLLLRQAGIPARYAIGFAVPGEESGPVYLVRARHAHAWTQAYINGTWRDFDATPASWNEAEEAQKTAFEPVTDLFSWLQYSFARWRYYGERGAIRKVLLWLAPVLLVWFSWRLFSQKRRTQHPDSRPRGEKFHGVGLDSEFYLIEKRLAQAGIPRRGGEPLRAWVDRVETTRHIGAMIPSLRDIIALHYAYRFDPRGVTDAQRHELRSRVDTWIKGSTCH
ncbi:MAG TPA: transglutaminase domain-containing protein [Verrucomicrobiae bacterium]|nr:transglutaminase domain-containing protein [Verrucomicrobiae bacterium]